MKTLTALSFLFLICSVTVCAGRRSPLFRFQMDHHDNTIDKHDIDEPSSEGTGLAQADRKNAINIDDEPSLEEADLDQDDRENAIKVDDEPSHSTTFTDSSGFINPHKAPTTFFEYIKEAFYGIFSGIYHTIFGNTH